MYTYGFAITLMITSGARSRAAAASAGAVGRRPCLPRSGWEAGTATGIACVYTGFPRGTAGPLRVCGEIEGQNSTSPIGKNASALPLGGSCAGAARAAPAHGLRAHRRNPVQHCLSAKAVRSGVAVNGKRDAVLAAALLVAHKHRLDRLLSGGFLWRSRANHATAAGRTSCGWVWTAASGRERRTISAAPNALLLLLRSSSILRSNCRGKAASELRAPLPSARRVLGRAYVVRTHVLGAGG